VQASHYPSCRVYDPAFAYETAVIVKDGLARLYGAEPHDEFYYVALYNENHVMPARPEGVSDDDIVRGLYRFAARPDLGAEAPRATILASGVIMQQALAAQKLLAETYGIAADVFSAPSFQQLRNEALEVEHWNLHNPGLTRRVPHVTQVLAEPGAAGPVIAVSDWIPPGRHGARWVPRRLGAAWARRMGGDAGGAAPLLRSTRRTSRQPSSMAAWTAAPDASRGRGH
jgi:pyruvate dehydrogenase E1 component